jgi:hypothetical protein
MAVDQTLISGAGAAARGRGVPSAKAFNDISKSFADLGTTALDKIKTDKEEAKKEAEVEEARVKKEQEVITGYITDAAEAEGLGLEEQKVLVNNLKALQEDFIRPDATPQEKQLIKQQLVEYASDIDDAFELYKQVGQDVLDPEFGINSYWADSDEGKRWIKGVTDPKSTTISEGNVKINKKGGMQTNTDMPNSESSEQASVNPTTNLGYMIKNEQGVEEWKSIAQIKAKFEENKTDQEFKNNIEIIADEQLDLSSKNTSTTSRPFNREAVRLKVLKQVNSTNNITSLATDPIITGAPSFRDDVMAALQSNTYKGLGITDQMIKNGDSDTNGKIDEEEAANIVDALIRNKENSDLLKNEITEYYTSKIQSLGYDVGAGNRKTFVTDPNNSENLTELEKSDKAAGGRPGDYFDSDGKKVNEREDGEMYRKYGEDEYTTYASVTAGGGTNIG